MNGVGQVCSTCNGAGKIKRLLMSVAALQRMSQLAAILPTEPVPVSEEKCPACHGLGEKLT